MDPFWGLDTLDSTLPTTNAETFNDISEEFDFDEETLEYCDAPLSGWLRRRRDGARFAFECRPIIWDKLWHWILVPAASKSQDHVRVLSEAAQRKQGTWLSITEDRRTRATSTCLLVEMDGVAPPVSQLLKSGGP